MELFLAPLAGILYLKATTLSSHFLPCVDCETVGVCVAAVSGLTSAVYSVARSAAAAGLLHALCFSAVKVGVRPEGLLPSPPQPVKSAGALSQYMFALITKEMGSEHIRNSRAWRWGLGGI